MRKMKKKNHIRIHLLLIYVYIYIYTYNSNVAEPRRPVLSRVVPYLSCGVLQCRAVSCYTVFRCAVLCYVEVYWAMTCRVFSCFVLFWYAAPAAFVKCSFVWCSTVLYCPVSHSAAPCSRVVLSTWSRFYFRSTSLFISENFSKQDSRVKLVSSISMKTTHAMAAITTFFNSSVSQTRPDGLELASGRVVHLTPVWWRGFWLWGQR